MKLRKLSLYALFAALLCLFAWIGFPIGYGFVTLQTFALLLCLNLLGGRGGSVVSFVYLLLGGIGMPVFSGFRGGLGMLLGATGGFLWGFLAGSLVYWLVTACLGQRFWVRLVGSVLCCLSCYACGSIWYLTIYLHAGWEALGSVILTCVMPYLLPDAIKLILALLLAKRLRRFLV